MAEPLSSECLWNPQQVLEMVDGSVEDLESLIKVWFKQTPRLLSEIRSAHAMKDVAKIRLAAHTLRGSLQILGADLICQTAQNFEEIEQSGVNRDETALLEELERQVSELTKQVRHFMDGR